MTSKRTSNSRSSAFGEGWQPKSDSNNSTGNGNHNGNDNDND